MVSVECFNCGTEYPPIATRWRCPMCGMKDTCCDGAPQGRTYLERPSKGKKYRPSEEDFYVD